MEKVTRAQLIDRLENSWRPFVARFYCLAPQAQQAYLSKQGYAAFPDLLAHVIAWWRDGGQCNSRAETGPFTGAAGL